MQKQITTNKAPQAVGPYSQAVVCNNLLFISGQVPINPKTNEVEKGSIQLQTKLVLNNIKAIIKEAGTSVNKIVKCEIFLKNINDFKQVNQIYTEFFKDSKILPARQCVEVSRLPLDVGIEISCIAFIN